MPTALDRRHATLGPGAFAAARERNRAWLRRLEPDRLLHRFAVNAGEAPAAPEYGGWEAATISGHTLGHALSAWAREAADDPVIAGHVERTVDTLLRLQRRRGDGFVGGMPEADRVFGELRRGIVRSSGFDLNDCWVPWCNVHKTLAGLVDTLRFTGMDAARTVLSGMVGWIDDISAGLSDTAWQDMLACEHGGMNEALADTAELLGDDRALALALRFHHDAVLGPLARGEDPLPGLHANTQIPKVLGCARLHEVAGDPRHRAIVERFLDLVLGQHTYANGGHGSGEHFGPPGQLAARLSNTNCESCNAVNLLRLVRAAYAWEPRPALADYLERTHINHILAGQRATDGMIAYFLPLESGRFRTWSTPEDSFWCCVGTGLEAHARHVETAAWRDGDTLRIGGWVPATLALPEGTVVVEAPDPNDAGPLVIRPSLHAPLDLRVHRPGWLAGPARIVADGRVVEAPVGDDGCWRLPDAREVRIERPRTARFESLPDAPDMAAVLRGPVLLAADLGPAPVGLREDLDEDPDANLPPAPVIVDANPDPVVWAQTLGLAPYHALADRRTAVYFPRFAPDAWEREGAAFRAREAADHRERTRGIDVFHPFQMQSERDHAYDAECTVGGERSAWKFRQAGPGGWFEATLAVLPGDPIEIVGTWGPPVDGAAEAWLSVDGVDVGTVRIDAGKHRHVPTVHAVPEPLTRGRTTARLRIRAGDLSAPPLFLLRTRRQAEAAPQVP